MPALRPRSFASWLLAGALALLTPSTSLAAPKSAATKAPDDAAVEEAAKARYAEGFRYFTKKRYEEARAAFLQAAALKHRPAAVLMLALSSLKTGRWLDASRELDAYVAEVGEVPAKLREIVESGRREARSHLGRLRIVVPEGAEITVDGERVARGEEPFDVAAGEHVIVVVHRDEKKVETVQVGPGSTVDVTPSFVPKPLVPTSDTRTTKAAAPNTVPSEKSSSILSPPTTTWPVYVAGAIGLGGLATAAIVGGLAANSSHAVDVANETLVRNGQTRATCDQPVVAPPFDSVCRTLRDNERLSHKHEETLGAALVVGASATVFAVGWFLLAPKERARDAEPRIESARIVPWIGLSTGGAAVEGRF
ncbi:MAG: Thiol-disulfide isomerase [Labilithrix sp.]|nr:Thiol-disulfide isomerase [Labilithrix sp.]